MVKLDSLITESRNHASMNLDCMTPLEIASVMNAEDYKVVEAVKRVLPQVAELIDWCRAALEHGGRVIYIGAGTSGRLGLLDAVECPPTFGVSPDTVMGLIAGGKNAFIKAVEHAEDDMELAQKELMEVQLSGKDIVVGLGASGRTPYVIGGLRYARKIGCKTAAISCNNDTVMSSEAQLGIEVITGAEVLTGSTRLKAGTAEKMILNMVSTGAMVGTGKVYQNLMVDMMQTNEKLKARAIRIVCMASECAEEEASEALERAGGDVKAAIVMISSGCDFHQAKERLKANRGHVRKALKD